MKEITLITTGGTIEKTYDEFDGSLANRESEIKKRISSKLRLPDTKLNVFSLMAKDSLMMTEYDRALIQKTIEVHMDKGRPIIILHGTDTMTKTAEYLQKHSKAITVPVIFTGAMRPMGLEDSDSTQNVTEALLAAKILTPGIYISFHSQIFTVPGVRKNKEKRTFEKFDE